MNIRDRSPGIPKCDISFDANKETATDRNCPVCGSDQRIALLQVTDTPIRGRDLHMAKCVSCQSAYFTDSDPVVGYSDESFERSYWLNYVQSGAGITGMLEPLLAIKRPRSGRLLDIGCGFGFVPHFWQECGFGESVGLETTAYGAMGAEKLGIRVVPQFYSNATELHGDKFDYVFSSDVLEHVEDPIAFVNEIGTALAKDGVLILTTPSSSILKVESPFIDVLAALSPDFHYFVASRNGLKNLLLNAGFLHVEVRDLGNRLFAWASHSPLPKIANHFQDWQLYLDYLNKLSDNPDPHVAAGALYREMKDSYNLRFFERANKVYLRFREIAKDTYGIDFENLSASENWLRLRDKLDNERYPSWLGCAIYYSGLVLKRNGASCENQVQMFRTAIETMQLEIKLGFQYAGEPAHFIAGARHSLIEATAARAKKEAATSDILPSYVLRHPGTLAAADTCLMAIYAPNGKISDISASYINLLSENGLSVVACVAVNDATLPVEISNLQNAAGIIVRQNGGMDFASWSAATRLLPEVWDSKRLVFTNDSIVALPALFNSFIEKLRTADAECVGLTESYAPVHHFQSYFLMFQGKALKDRRLQDFWMNLTVVYEKKKVIELYETRIHALATKAWGFTSQSLYSFAEMFPTALAEEKNHLNVSHAYWEYLIQLGMPFVKVELLRDNPLRLNILHWRYVLARYGVEISSVESHLSVPRGASKKSKGQKSGWQIILSELNHIRLGIRRRRRWRKSASW